jgi:hypothetical protein
MGKSKIPNPKPQWAFPPTSKAGEGREILPVLGFGFWDLGFIF